MENTNKTTTNKTTANKSASVDNLSTSKSTNLHVDNSVQEKELSDAKPKTSTNEWSKREVGALWKRKSATQFYLSGHVNLDFDKKYKIMIFTNKHKKLDSHPDYRVYLQDTKDSSSKPVELERSEPKDDIL